MNISNIARAVYAGQIDNLGKTSQSSAAQTLLSAGQGTGSDSLEVSKPAEFLSKMAQLQHTDPAKFHETMKQSAGQLRLAAQQMQAQAFSQMLTSFADQFDEAAESDSMSETDAAGTNLYSQLQNPLSQYANPDQNSLSGLLASIQPQLKANPQLQDIFTKMLNSIDATGEADLNAS